MLILMTAIMILSIATVSSSATSVSITATSRQAKLGIFMYNYFENTNAPSSSSPIVVDTQSSIPASSGSFLIPKGTSAYLWTNQFSSATAIPSGKMTLDLWGGPTPALDGQASAGFNAASGSVSLTTTQTNDVVYVALAIRGTGTATISGGGLTWISRGSTAVGTTGQVKTFYAISSGTLSSASITATLSTSRRFVISAIGISGADTTSPFDPNLSTPAMSTGTSTNPSVSFTTTKSNDMVIGAAFINNNPTVNVGAAFNSIAITTSGSTMFGANEYKNGASSGSQTVSFSLSTSNAWALIGDALVPATAGTTILVSAYTTNSAGTTQSTLFSGLNSNNIPSNSGQVATVFSVASGNIPSLGYIKITLTAPLASTINIQWGNGKPTNFQIAYTYS